MKPKETSFLLMLLPFWEPQTPPLGISCLKTFLQQQGYRVKAIDANTEMQFREIYDSYFNLLKTYIPEARRRHLYNIGHEVLKHHLTAHRNYTDRNRYGELVKELVFKTFFTPLDNPRVDALTEVISRFYQRLETYLANILAKEKPAVLGLSVYGSTLAASLFAFKQAKEMCPGIKTVMGGVFFPANWQWILRIFHPF